MMSKKSPQLRFEGFTDDWEERKLKELGEIQTGNTPPTSDSDNYSLDGVPWVTPTDIKSLVISNTAKKLSQVGVTKARIAKAGSILVTSIASIGKNTLLRMDAGFNQQINSLTPTSENDSYFLLTQSEKWSEKMKQTAASATMQIVNKTDFSNISTYVPVHKEEQEKIGLFFKQLDNTITLHQRKLDLLKEQKKGFLQKMFPKNGAKVPELRFAGFADDWEDRKLSSIAERVTRKNKNNESTLPLTISAQDGLVDQNDYFNKQVASRDVTGYFLVKNGEFAYNKSYSNGYPWGAIKRLDKYEMGVLSTLYIVFKPTAINSQFLVSYYETTRWYREVSKNAAEGARNHGLLNISPNDFFNTLLTIPKSAEEQQQIGSFFKQLDDTIALHQRKLDLLKEQKKGFIKQMFV
ncbi:MAG: restriction endonuclease subunit S [Streptococcus thermophilus]|uniref:restriction endonuclease subunit S n=1 Tax=Streptococcus thermophilus TaxID=1308 RepID=UPI000EB6D394|nr:restriction endonuclease subunit S [Streptococcus thermophilus]AXT16123.1 restriction endonuclease subunit S [Streptococcus thermophilus]